MAIRYLRWSELSIAQKLSQAFICILLLLGMNLAVYAWGDLKRESTLNAFRQGLARQVALLSILEKIENIHRQALLFGQIEIKKPLTGPEQAFLQEQILSLRSQVETFNTLKTHGTLDLLLPYRQVEASWLRYFAAYGVQQDKAVLELAATASPLTQYLLEVLIPKIQTDERLYVEGLTGYFYSLPRLVSMRALGIFTISLVSAAILAYLIARDIVRRLAALQSMAQRISQGDLSQTISTRHGDELDQLAGTLNTMTSRLIASRQELVTANQEMEAFTYSVSHDLRGPLNHILRFSQAIHQDCQGQLSDEGKHYLSRIQLNGAQMNQLIEALLLLFRISRQEMSHEMVYLCPIAEEIAESLQQKYPDHPMTFEIQKGWVAHGDSRLLRVLLENLLNNAVKFSLKASSVKIEMGEREGACFIRDHGVGFDMAYVQKLFRPFQRLHPVTEFEGSGIGLSIVWRIVSRHGGKIWAEGALGEGATFYFTLPASRKDS